MKGIILAAGIGSRLRPLTSERPKCLVATAGKPILQYQIDAYRAAGITELIIAVGYEGAKIREYCKPIRDITIHIVENPDYETTNNMVSLYRCRDYVGEDGFILNNADLAIDSGIVKTLVDDAFENAIAVDRTVYSEESMKITVADGCISDISKTITEASAYGCSIDFYKFSAQGAKQLFAEICRVVEDEGNLKDWTEVAMQRLFRDRTIIMMPCDISGQKWVEIDNYEDLIAADRAFSHFDACFRRVDTVLFDLDGTLFVGERPIEGAAQAVSRLRSTGRRVYFLSNNSSKSKTQYVDRLSGFGIQAAEDEIILSTDALLQYLLDHGIRETFVLGTQSLKGVLQDHGIATESPQPEYVVVGYDTELNYDKLVQACQHVNAGVDMLATHSDVFCPSENGPIPDIGALLEMIRMTTGARPLKTFGKPNASMVSTLQARLKIRPERTLVVGDRLYTDILMANNARIQSLVVLTGETRRDALQDAAVQPTYVLNSVADILP